MIQLQRLQSKDNSVTMFGTGIQRSLRFVQSEEGILRRERRNIPSILLRDGDPMKSIPSEYDSKNKNQNLRQLRTFLHMTQGDFLDAFFHDAEGKRLFSVAKLSSLESYGGAQLDPVIVQVSEQLGLEPLSFGMEPQEFYDHLSEKIPNQHRPEEFRDIGVKEGNISRLVNRLTLYIADQILSGKLHRGEKIASDRALAQELGVGRSAIREGLKVLNVMGMIDIRPGDGTYISSQDSDFFIIPLSWSLFMSGAQIDNILEMRDIIEVRSAELAAGCRDEARLSRLQTVFEEMKIAYEARDSKTFLELDVEFHVTIALCSGNQILSSLIQTIRSLLKWVSERGMSTEEHLRGILEEHTQIYERILSGNAEEAGKAMHEHLEHSKLRYTM